MSISQKLDVELWQFWNIQWEFQNFSSLYALVSLPRQLLPASDTPAHPVHEMALCTSQMPAQSSSTSSCQLSNATVNFLLYRLISSRELPLMYVVPFAVTTAMEYWWPVSVSAQRTSEHWFMSTTPCGTVPTCNAQQFNHVYMTTIHKMSPLTSLLHSSYHSLVNPPKKDSKM